jgi:hypothetical protein
VNGAPAATQANGFLSRSAANGYCGKTSIRKYEEFQRNTIDIMDALGWGVVFARCEVRALAVAWKE